MTTADEYQDEVFKRLDGFRRTSSREGEDPQVSEMRRNRAVMRRQANAVGPGPTGANVSFATGRPRDPMFYWKQNNLPYDLYDHRELKKVRAYCNTPEAPVWMGDYSFKPIGEVVEGDEVIGWTYRQGPLGNQRKVLTRTRVLATQRRIAPEVVRVTLESGQVIRCTPDHLWANPHFSTHVGPSGWTQPEYRPAKVGQDLIRVVHPTEPLSDEKLHVAAAWLGGVYDGEGTGERIAQDEVYNPAVRERIKHSLDLLGLPWTEDARAIKISKTGRKGGAGAHQDLVNFLNWADPVRRTSNAIDERLLCRPSAGRDRVVSIESEGSGEVVSMQTETGNYTAWGLASKNCRLLYQSHPMIGSCVDIYTKYPLLGMELTCKDNKLTEFYSDLFLDEEGLNYPEFFIDFGREYWTVGESVPFGSFNESLGIWDDEELLNPDDLEVQRSPFLKDPRYFIHLPETLREIITKRSPAWEYQKLMEAYPELAHYTAEDALMPVSSILLRHYRFKADTFNKRGVPLLMRAMRPIMQEEMLNAAMDAVADRLYTPLILARLGVSASDLGTTQPWIPTDGDLEDFEEALDNALAADFRVLVHHFGVQMEPVFGRENMPDMTADFERIEDRILQTFGLSKTMLTGASSGQTYAADALNRDLISQLLTTYQNLCISHYRQRALVVAEAQEHYDYEERNGKRYVKMEEILEIDEESGEERIVEQPKLLIPDMKMRTMNIKDEEAERQFYESLRAAGVPISIKTRLVNVPIEFADEIEQSKDEAVELAIAEQETRKAIFEGLRDAGLPIPEDLAADFQPRAAQSMPPAAGVPTRVPMLGIDPVVNLGNLAPTEQDEAQPEPGAVVPGMGAMPVSPFQPAVPVPGDAMMGQQGPPPDRPEESDEQREDMPKAASIVKDEAGLYRAASRMREIVKEHYKPPRPLGEVQMRTVAKKVGDGDETEDVQEPITPEDGIARGRWADPKHIGMRRHAGVTRNTLWGSLEEDPEGDED